MTYTADSGSGVVFAPARGIMAPNGYLCLHCGGHVREGRCTCPGEEKTAARLDQIAMARRELPKLEPDENELLLHTFGGVILDEP